MSHVYEIREVYGTITIGITGHLLNTEGYILCDGYTLDDHVINRNITHRLALCVIFVMRRYRGDCINYIHAAEDFAKNTVADLCRKCFWGIIIIVIPDITIVKKRIVIGILIDKKL